MRNVSGATANETKMIKAIQAAVGAVQDGSIGAQTMSDIARRLDAQCFPLSITIYGHPVIICKSVLPAAVNAPLNSYALSISGSFSSYRKPCSILVADGRVVCGNTCHQWLGKPESVLYCRKDGSYGITRALSSADLPKDLIWAVGGVGLLENYSPATEGFTGKYADVLRKTAHTFIGIKQGWVYLGYVSDMTVTQVNNHVKKLGLDCAVMLDGGHVAAINAETRVNTATTQYYIIQAR